LEVLEQLEVREDIWVLRQQIFMDGGKKDHNLIEQAAPPYIFPF